MYYVTLCVKTARVTKAIQWFYNAQFETLSAAENYKNKLLPLVDKINSSPPNEKRITNIEGERIIVVTNNPAPNIQYTDMGNESKSRPPGHVENNIGLQKSGKNIVPPKRKTRKPPEYVKLYHGPRVKKSNAKWLERQDANAARLFFGILGFMLLLQVLSRCS